MTRQSRQQDGVVCLGRIYCDLVFRDLDGMPQLGREVFAQDFSLTPGGGALITAAHIASLGRPAALLARLGTDELSSAVEARTESLGIELQFVERHPDAGPQLTVVMAHDSDRAFLSRRAGHARPQTLTAALDWGRATHLHIAEFATLDEVPEAIIAARARGLTTSLDPSWDDRLIRAPDFLDRAAGVDVFLPNQEEATALTGQDDPAAALTVLADRFPVVALKCGGDGAWLSHRGRVLHLPSRPVQVVDTTGAGDAFNAGFLDAWLAGATPEACLAQALETGTRSVQARGGTGSLEAAE